MGPSCEACSTDSVMRRGGWGGRGGEGAGGVALHPGRGAPDRGGRGAVCVRRRVLDWRIVEMGRRAVC